MRIIKLVLTVCMFTYFLSACKEGGDTANTSTEGIGASVVAPEKVEPLSYTVTNTFTHAPNMFTQGLQVHNGILYESTGSPEELQQTKSQIGISDLDKGVFTAKVTLDRNKYFGEGICILNDKVYQITYKNQEGFVYDLKDFKLLKTFKYPNLEGWGLTTDGTYVIMSDGTNALTFLDPEALTQVKTLNVTEYGQPLGFLNELEYIKGYVYANVWMSNYIVKIDPSNGKVVGKMDMASLVYEARTKNPAADVLNGIAYDAEKDKIYITGKLWHNIYEIAFPH